MKVCIAEKPSVAQDIASVIGATRRCEGYFEGNGYQVTWTFGHLCRLKTPEEYDSNWKSWAISTLPMIPDNFGIRLIEGTSIRKQFSIIKKLFSSADCIINCGDAGQEGELIQRWVMQLANVKCPVKRLWISSLTEESIRMGFLHLRNQEDYDSLYYAGLARASGDWLLGMNATRLYTLRYGARDTLLSVGRVQTPTLALIVNRQKEINQFVSQPYWQLTTRYRNTLFRAINGDYHDKTMGEQALVIVEGKPFIIDNIIRNKGSEAPPQLYDLTSLQVDCNRRFGYSAETTLSVIQSLYEKKLTTYPRVDTRYLSDDIYSQCQGILNNVTSTYPNTKSLVISPLIRSSRVFDSTKVTDHHAIIPTGKVVAQLTDKEQKVYDMVTRRFISVFCGDCTFMATTIMAHSGEVSFKASGKEILEWGWRKMYDKRNSGDGEDGEESDCDEGNEYLETDGHLPNFKEGERGDHLPVLSEKRTVAPKHYTEATLLRAMETAGKFVDDEELRAALKQNGIGRPSSRANIIETLFKRGYVIRQNKAIVPTPVGISLINTIRSELLKSCELTGIWEKKLREIENDHYDFDNFMNELKLQLSVIIDDVKNDQNSGIITAVRSNGMTKGKGKKKSPKQGRRKR